MLPHNARDIARSYIANGLSPIPIPPSSKRPILHGWQDLRLTSEHDLDQWFMENANVGVLLGQPSRWLVDIDLDCTEAVIVARQILPQTRVFGRKSHPDSHYLYFSEGVETSKYQYKGKMLVELRSTGTQTIFPGSIHEGTGESITWSNKDTPLVTLAAGELQGRVAQVAAAAMLARELSTWTSGRHDVYLSLTGALLRSGLQKDDVLQVLYATIDGSGDPERSDRIRAVDDTAGYYADGGDVQGWPTLAGQLPDGIIKKLRSWLPIDDYAGLIVGGKPAKDAVAEVAAVTALHPPDPLYRELPPAEPFPIDSLGDVLSPMAAAMQEIIQAPAALCGQSVLAAAALAVQAHGNIEIDGRIYPGSLYLVTVADSGERKTAADKEALAPHRKFEQDRMTIYREDLQIHEADAVAYQRMRDVMLKSKDNSDRESKRDAIMELGEPPAEPISLVLLVEEPTYEGLVKQLHTGWPSVGLFSDEGGRFVGGHGMNSDHQLKTAAGLSSLWDGSPITRVRSGEGTVRMTGRRLSAHLMIQPSVSAMLFSNRLLMSQGLLSRMLVACPETTIGQRPYKAVSLRDRPEAVRYFARMMDLLERDLPLVEKHINTLEPRPLQLEPAAKSTWIEYHDHIESQCNPDGELYSIKGLAAKAAEQAARIALVLAMVDDIAAVTVQERYLDAGIELSQFYLAEGLRLFDAAPMDIALDHADKLLSWAAAQGKATMTTREIYRHGPRCIRSKQVALAALEVLRSHNWVYQSGNEWVFRDELQKV